MSDSVKSKLNKVAKGLEKKLKSIVDDLEYALSKEGPYLFKVDGEEQIVNREQFLEFFIDCSINEISELLDGDENS